MSSSQQQSGGSSSSRSRSEVNRVVTCYHNAPAPLRTVRFNGPNLGRTFYGCPYWPDDPCGFLRWANQVADLRHLQLKIQEYMTENAELEMKNEMLEEKIKKLQQRFDSQEEQLKDAWMENATLRDGLYSANADKKLMIALILSWVFFAVVFMKMG